MMGLNYHFAKRVDSSIHIVRKAVRAPEAHPSSQLPIIAFGTGSAEEASLAREKRKVVLHNAITNGDVTTIQDAMKMFDFGRSTIKNYLREMDLSLDDEK